MDDHRVFLRGPVKHRQVLAALEVLQEFDVLDGPVGPVDVLGIRGEVLVEFVHQHRERNRRGARAANLPMMVRFTSTAGSSAARTAAHAFLWMLTRRYPVREALLIGPDVETLRFRDDRFLPVASESRYSED